MSLTEEQKKEAERLYIESCIPDEDRRISEEIKTQKKIKKSCEEKITQLRSKCSHPLIARDYKNEGVSGHWDGYSSYWTNHDCKVCGLSWRTGQRWQHVGGKHGHPDDKEAKEKDYD